ncbi:hypothetical protein, partial [Azotobacter vinelandii]|uniref:hypothetical protein n=1 Tax=Azotobacter vinelandii TaxID=354 RepID=UPI00091EA33A
INMLQSAGVAATATLLVMAAGAMVAHDANSAELPEPDVTLRNVQILDTARESWAVATAVNSSGVVLEEPIIILELEDGTEVRHVGPARVEPGDAWRIVEPIHGEAASGFAQGGRQ